MGSEPREHQGRDDDLPLASLTSVVELIGHYIVERELGGGATGRVLACKDQDLGRDVAIKILHEDLLHDETALARFKREGQVLAKIDSPHVVRILQIGVQGKVPYIVMERVDGEDAEGALRAHGAMSPERVVAIGRDVARGLAAVHGAGVLHRDVKPSNVLLSSTGAKLGDFGLAAPIEGSAQLTQVGTIPGTAATMAPERLRNTCDERSDLYALGCTLYALASGAMPFDRGSAIEVLAAHANEPAPRLALEGPCGAPLADVVDRLLYKSPERRFQTAAALAAALDEILSAPARRQAQEKRDALAKKIEVLLGSESEVPKIPEVPSVDELVPPEEPAEVPAPSPAPPPGPSAAAISSDALPFVSAEIVVPPELAKVRMGDERAPRVAVAQRWRSLSPGARRGLVAVAGAVVLTIAAVLVFRAPSSAADAADLDDVTDARVRIDAGDADAVLKELAALGDAQKPVHHLIRAHALVAHGARAEAFASFRKAARGKVVDARALEIAVGALEDEDATDAIDLLVAWPTDEVVSRLGEVVQEGEWWPRHHALTVLDRRKQADRVDVTALGVRDLRDGPTCNKRKHGLTILKERGQGKEALAAIDAAQRRSDNGCIWFGDWDAARRAVRSR
jgi:serine/threonine protein kinase